MAKTRRVGRSLINVATEFGTEEQCLAYLERMRWPEGVRCLACESEKVSKFTTKESTRKRFSKMLGKEVEVKVPARHLYQCLACGKQFSATLGTLFHDTHLPLRKWFLAIALVCNAKKGLSALQLQRDLEVSYRTAWYLYHRIRKAMEENDGSLLGGTVEADEAYIGGRVRGKGTFPVMDNKTPVFGLIERGGRVRTWPIPKIRKEHILSKIAANVAIEANLYTDEHKLYRTLKKIRKHESVAHVHREYVRGDLHTGTIDNYWGLLKRGLIGSYHRVSIKHLHRYLAEFQYRWNNKEQQDMFTLVIVQMLIASAMEYKALTSGETASGRA